MATETFRSALMAILRCGFGEEMPFVHSGWPAPPHCRRWVPRGARPVAPEIESVALIKQQAAAVGADGSGRPGTPTSEEAPLALLDGTSPDNSVVLAKRKFVIPGLSGTGSL